MLITPNIRKSFFVAAGIFLSIFFVAASVRNMNWNQVRAVLSNARLYPWLFFSIASYLAGHLVRGLRTSLLISRDAQLSAITASNIVVLGYAVNNVIPARVGEFARAGMLSERTGIPLAQSLSVVFLERIFDGIVIVLLLTGAVLFLPHGTPVQESLFLLSLLFGVAAVCIIFIVFAPHRFTALMSRAINAGYPSGHDAMLRFLTSLVNGVAYLRSPVSALKVFIISCAVWLGDIGLFLFLMPAFGIESNLVHAVFVMASVNLGSFFFTSPGYSSPGYIGPFQTLCINAAVLLGTAQTTAVNYSVMVHLGIYIPMCIWGGIFILWYGTKLGLAINLTKKAKAISALPEQVTASAKILGFTAAEKPGDSASPFIFSLTEAIVPLDCLPPQQQQTVVLYVADFVQGEINSLSKKLYLLFKVGMFGFNTLIWLRYFRTFSLLSVSQRRAIVNAWAYGKIPVARKLFKLVRSTALLAFFEHPAVVAKLEREHSTESCSPS